MTKFSVIPAWMPESSHKDVMLFLAPCQNITVAVLAGYHPWHCIPAALEFTMHTVKARKQGVAAVITILPDVLRTLPIGVGATLSIKFDEGAVKLKPAIKKTRKHYTLTELLQGVTPVIMDALNADTAWAREGAPCWTLAKLSRSRIARAWRHLMD